MSRKVGDKVAKMGETVKPVKDKAIGLGKMNMILQALFGATKSPARTFDARLPPWTLRMAQYCCYMSQQVYLHPDERVFPPELGDVIFDERVTAKYRIPYMILNSDHLNRIFIVCRGSYCMNDFLVDAQGKCKEWKGGWAHKGVLKTAIYLYSSLRLLVKTLSMAQNKRPVTVTGHSLGAGVAGIVVELFRDEFPEFKTTGLIFAPCATLSEEVWAQTRGHTLSFCLDGDFVPFLSLHNFRALFPKVPKVVKNVIVKMFGSGISDPEKKKKAKKESEKYRRKKEKKRKAKMELPLPPSSLGEVLASSTAKFSTLIPLYSPGDVYLLLLMEDKTTPTKTRVHLRALESMTYFDHFINNLSESRHSVDLYVEWVNGLAGSVDPTFGPIVRLLTAKEAKKEEKQEAREKKREEKALKNKEKEEEKEKKKEERRNRREAKKREKERSRDSSSALHVYDNANNVPVDQPDGAPIRDQASTESISTDSSSVSDALSSAQTDEDTETTSETTSGHAAAFGRFASSSSDSEEEEDTSDVEHQLEEMEATADEEDEMLPSSVDNLPSVVSFEAFSVEQEDSAIEEQMAHVASFGLFVNDMENTAIGSEQDADLAAPGTPMSDGPLTPSEFPVAQPGLEATSIEADPEARSAQQSHHHHRHGEDGKSADGCEKANGEE